LTVDELQLHLSRWSVVRRHLLADRRLWTTLQTISHTLDTACRRLGELSRSAVQWTRRIVEVGFRVLAHGDLDRMPQDTLWNVARGLERFNWLASTPLRYELGVGEVKSWRRLSRHSRVTLSSVLRLLAAERSKYAAASAVQHFACNPYFLERGPHVPTPPWLPAVLTHAPPLTGVPDMVEPDVVSQPSPLVDFNRRETTFIARFLHAVCHSSNLIRPNSAAEFRPRLAETRCPGSSMTSCDVSVDRSRTGRRKNVSWGDTSVSVAMQATARRYMGDLWRLFVRHLMRFLVNLEWKETTRLEGRGRLGSIVVCPHSATLLLARMIQQAAADGTHSALRSSFKR